MSTDRTREQISHDWMSCTDARELSDHLWDEVLVARRARDDVREERDAAVARARQSQAERQADADRMTAAVERMDAALAEVASLKAHIAAQTWDADCDRLEGLEAQVARLQDDVVELTQAGDLHRKEGDEARALLREAFPFVEATTKRAHAQGGYNLLRRMSACLAADTYAPVEPRTVLAEVLAERDRQDARWGEQNHPDTVHTTRISHGIAASDVYRRCIQARPSWALILLEEVAEAVEAIGDVTALRAELVQVAAVAVAWVEALDRRQGGDRG